MAEEPSDDGWVGLDEVLDDGAILDSWYAGVLAGPARGHADVAGSFLAAWLSSVIGGPVAAAVLGQHGAWSSDPAALSVHRHPEGWFDGFAVARSIVLVLPDDPDAAHPGTEVVATVASLRARVADDLVPLLERIFAGIRARAPFGLRGMWGSLADHVGAIAVALARRSGGGHEQQWAAAAALLDAMAERASRVVARPALRLVDWSGGVAPLSVRGTCCLWYKTNPRGPDRGGEDFCTTCPLRHPGDADRRWATFLAEEAQREAARA